jgi:hypothetical protein
MMRFLRPRLRVPAAVAVLGTAATTAVVIGQGWAPAIYVEIAWIALAAGYYAWGGRDTDRGALMGSRADERQASLQMKVTAFQGKVMTLAAAAAYLYAIAVHARPIWPFILFILVSGVSGMVGWGIYREHGAEADGPAPEHFTAPQSPESPMPRA